MNRTTSRLLRPLFARPARRPPRRARPLTFERLEDRVVPSTITWNGSADHAAWENGGNWDLGRAPQNGDDVVIPAVAGTASLTHAATAGNVFLHTLTTSLPINLNGGALSTTAGMTLNATVTIDNGASLAFNGNQTLGGTGDVVFGAHGTNRLSLDSNTTLTVAATMTVHGQNGEIGPGNFDNGGTKAVINNGTIADDVSGGTCTLDPNGGVTNNGVLSAQNGGTFDLYRIGLNNGGGQVNALDGSTVVQDGTTIVGGTLASSGTGAFSPNARTDNYLSAVTVNGNIDLSHGSNERVVGGLTLNGTAMIDNGGNLGFGNSSNTGAQTLGGTATVVFGATGTNRLSLDNTVTLTLGANVLVRGKNFEIGPGAFDNGGTKALVNNGTITCDVAGGTCTLDPNGGVTNNSVLSAQSGGTLDLYRIGLNNAGTAHVDVVGASTLVQDGTTLNGTVNVASTGDFLPNARTDNYLSAVTVNGNIDLSQGGNERVVGGLTINGTVSINNSGNLGFGNSSNTGAQTLGGTATVVFGATGTNRLSLDNNCTLTIAAGVLVHGKDFEIGPGNFDNGGTKALVNNGTITCDVAGGTCTLDPNGGVTNNSVLSAQNGGTLDLYRIGLNNSGAAHVDVVGASTLVQDGTTLNGTVNVASTGEFLPNARTDNYLSAATVNGNIDLSQGSNERVVGGLTLNGTATIDNGGALGFNAGAQTLGGTATVVFGGTGTNRLSLDNNCTLTIAAGVLVHGKNFEIGPGTFDNGGTKALVNNGTITCDVAGGTCTLDPNGGVTNNSVLSAQSGGTLDLYRIGLNNSGAAHVDVVGASTLVQDGTTLNGTVNVASTGEFLPNARTDNYLSAVTVNGNIDLSHGANERVVGGLTLNGTVSINNSGNLGFGNSSNTGAQTLGGSATIVFGATGTNRLSLDNTVTLTIASGVLVHGQNFEIGPGTFDNGGTKALVNNGTITCDVAGGTLTLDPNGGVTNNSVLSAQNGGTLDLYRIGLNNVGAAHVDVLGASTLVQDGTTINGTLNISSAGAFLPNSRTDNYLSAVTVNGNIDLSHGANERVVGGLTLNGTVAIDNSGNLGFGNGGNQGAQTLGGNATVVFGGTGTNRLSLDSNCTLTIAAGVLVHGKNFEIGPGAFDNGGTKALVNNGTITCDVSGGTAYLDPNGGVTNNSALSAQNGGTLDLYRIGLNNVGAAHIDALAGGTLVQDGSTLNGTVNVAGSGEFLPNNRTDNYLSAVTINGNIDLSHGGYERIVGGLTVNGAVNINNSGILAFGNSGNQGAQTLGGSAVITFGGAGGNRLSLDSNVTLTVADNVFIHGQNGEIGTGAFDNGGTKALVNNGTLSADFVGGTITLDPNGGVTNNNTLSAQNGGTLDLFRIGLTNTGGQVNALDGSTVIQDGGTIAGGTLGGSGTFLPNNRSDNYLSAVTLAGKLDLSHGAYERIVGGITVNGTIAIDNGGILGFANGGNQGAQTAGGSGAIVFGAAAGNRISLDSNVTLTLGPGLVVHGQNGEIGTGAFDNGGTKALVNNGTIREDGPGTLTLDPNGGLTNNGTLGVAAGGTLVSRGSFANFGGGTLTGGTYQVSGTFQFDNANVVTDAANVILDGTSAAVVNQSGANGLANFSTIAGTGSLTVTDGLTFALAGNLTDNGSLTVGPAADVTVAGNYAQAAGAALTVQLGGPPSGGQFGQLGVQGSAALAGTLNVSLVGGYGPVTGQSFTVMTFGSSTGTFATFNGLVFQGVTLFQANFNPTNLTLTAVANAPDLAAGSVAVGPAQPVVGQNVTVTYVVQNLSTLGTFASGWVDSIYLDTGTTLDASAVFLGTVPHSGAVAANGTYSGSLTVALPPILPGPYHAIVVVDSGGQNPDSNRTNNTATSSGTLTTDVTHLMEGTPLTGDVRDGQDLLFRLDVPAGHDVMVAGAFTGSPEGRLYVRFGALPDSAHYDLASPDATAVQQQVPLLNTQAGTYFVLLHGLQAAGGGRQFTLSAREMGFEVISVSPGLGINLNPALLTVRGSHFTAATTATLKSGNGPTISPTTTQFVDSNTLKVTFDLTGVSPGVYDLHLADGTQTAVATGALTVLTAAHRLFTSDPTQVDGNGVVQAVWGDVLPAPGTGNDTGFPAPFAFAGVQFTLQDYQPGQHAILSGDALGTQSFNVNGTWTLKLTGPVTQTLTGSGTHAPIDLATLGLPTGTYGGQLTLTAPTSGTQYGVSDLYLLSAATNYREQFLSPNLDIVNLGSRPVAIPVGSAGTVPVIIPFAPRPIFGAHAVFQFDPRGIAIDPGLTFPAGWGYGERNNLANGDAGFIGSGSPLHSGDTLFTLNVHGLQPGTWTIAFAGNYWSNGPGSPDPYTYFLTGTVSVTVVAPPPSPTVAPAGATVDRTDGSLYVTITGSGLGAAAQAQLTDGQGNVVNTTQALTVGGGSELTAHFTTTSAGTYALTVLDSNGHGIATTGAPGLVVAPAAPLFTLARVDNLGQLPGKPVTHLWRLQNSGSVDGVALVQFSFPNFLNPEPVSQLAADPIGTVLLNHGFLTAPAGSTTGTGWLETLAVPVPAGGSADLPWTIVLPPAAVFGANASLSLGQSFRVSTQILTGLTQALWQPLAGQLAAGTIDNQTAGDDAVKAGNGVLHTALSGLAGLAPAGLAAYVAQLQPLYAGLAAAVPGWYGDYSAGLIPPAAPPDNPPTTTNNGLPPAPNVAFVSEYSLVAGAVALIGQLVGQDPTAVLSAVMKDPEVPVLGAIMTELTTDNAAVWFARGGGLFSGAPFVASTIDQGLQSYEQARAAFTQAAGLDPTQPLLGSNLTSFFQYLDGLLASGTASANLRAAVADLAAGSASASLPGISQPARQWAYAALEFAHLQKQLTADPTLTAQLTAWWTSLIYHAVPLAEESDVARTLPAPGNGGPGPGPGSPGGSTTTVPTTGGYDPNEISVTPAGAPDQGWVGPGQQLTYWVHFENDPAAPGAAENVRVVAHLDPSLDPATVQVGAASFAGEQFAFDPGSGTLTWLLPEVNLPPNVESPEGEGYVSFTAALRSNVATGTQVSEAAQVFFDYNPPVSTAAAVSTVDQTAPSSSVQALPAKSPLTFRVRWAGTDTGSGIATYSVYYSDNGGAFVPLDLGTTDTSTSFTGQDGHTYGFYSVATDNAGNVQPTPAAAQATTTVLAPIALVGGPQVNGDVAALAGKQRSMVKDLVYTFNHAVTLAAGAFTIALHPNVTVNGKTGQTVGVLPALSYSSPDGGVTWVVTFSGAGVVNGSIADGVYDLTLNAASVTDDAGQVLSANRVDTFYRLFGDADGNHKVNNADLAAFSAAFNKRSNQAGYLAYFDYDGSGRIGNGALAQFANRFNTAFAF